MSENDPSQHQPENYSSPEDSVSPEVQKAEGFENAPSDQGLSLEALSQTFSDLIDSGEEPYEFPEEQASDSSQDDSGEIDLESESTISGQEDHCELTPRSILEAMLFIGHPQNEPLSNQYAASRMRGVRPQEVDDLVRELNEIYKTTGRAYRIESVGGGYQLSLLPRLNSLRDKFYGRVKQARLSQMAIDILAIIAYNQPMERSEIDDIRGKQSSTILSQLVRRKLLRIERSEDNPRSPHYFTTARFLTLFGLESLEDLPRSEDLDRTM